MKIGRALRHGMLGRRLLLLRGRRRRRDEISLSSLARDDAGEDVTSHADVGWLGRAGVLGRTADGAGSSAPGLKLTTKVCDLVLVPWRAKCQQWAESAARRMACLLLLEVHVCLFHGVNLLADQLHLADLGLDCIPMSVREPGRDAAVLTLVLVVFAGTHLALELAADLVEELAQAAGTVAGRHAAHNAVAWIHGHDGDRTGFNGRCDGQTLRMEKQLGGEGGMRAAMLGRRRVRGRRLEPAKICTRLLGGTATESQRGLSLDYCPRAAHAVRAMARDGGAV